MKNYQEIFDFHHALNEMLEELASLHARVKHLEEVNEIQRETINTFIHKL